MRAIIPVEITADMIEVGTTIAEPYGSEVAYSATTAYAAGEQAYTDHVIYESLRGDLRACTITNASPAKVALTGGYLIEETDDDGNVTVVAAPIPDGTPVVFRGTVLPSPLVANAVYFTKGGTVANSEIAATPGGTSINTTTAGTGPFSAVLSPNKGNAPGELTAYWFKVGATNRHALFDDDVDTATTDTGGAGVTTYVVSPGQITGWALFGLVGNSLDVEAKVGGDTVYGPFTYSLDGSVVIDDYTYMFAPFLQRTQVVDAEVPPYDATWYFSLHAPADRQIATLKMGESVYLGSVEDGSASSGYLSYSGITETAQGRVKLVKRRKVPEVSLTTFLELHEVNAAANAWGRLDGLVSVFVGDETDEGLREPLSFLGFPTEVEGTHHVTHSTYRFTGRGI